MDLPSGVTVTASVQGRFAEVLTPEACDFVAQLHRRFEGRRREILAARDTRQAELDRGERYDFLPNTADIRNDESWTVAPPASGLSNRRVEITGPTSRKMTINALNSGANVWLADLEDANTPLWENMVGGQLNLIDALDGRIDFEDSGKQYRLVPASEQATMVVRPRGWHLDEKHFLVDAERCSASLFDFGLYFFHCAKRQLDRGLGPYFYLPKLESHLEARLWNDVFVLAQDLLGIPQGTIRATVLLETIPAAFEMDEILYELRDHSSGLNAGRWDYLFSIIKKFRNQGDRFLMGERNTVTMTAPFMRAYTQLLVHTCHKRRAHAIGGMSAFVPNRRDPEVNEAAFEKVRQDKQRESKDGFDGSWVAHPDLVPVCREIFDSILGESDHQCDRLPSEGADISAADLLNVTATPEQFTGTGLSHNINVALRYLAAWMTGTGAVTIFNLMEDAATAEICRSQVWQWLHNGVVLHDGTKVDVDYVETLIAAELAMIKSDTAAALACSYYDQATRLFREVCLKEQYLEYLTIPGYELMP